MGLDYGNFDSFSLFSGSLNTFACYHRDKALAHFNGLFFLDIVLHFFRKGTPAW